MDETWCLGDVVGYGAQPIVCADLVQERCSICLVGNHDLAALAQSCSSGDMAACDDLWLDTDAGGVLEAYAETCGGLEPAGGVFGSCEEQFG